jgi:microcystin-dependent protein
MSEPYVGEIRMAGFNFAPVGWALCNGQLLAISQNPVLFTLVGTTYGGDGQSTFALPNLQGRIPINQGQGPGLSPYVIGQLAGSETVALVAAQLPQHGHSLRANGDAASSANPTGDYLARARIPSLASGGVPVYAPAAAAAAMNDGAIAPSGASQPHDNMMPFQCVNFIIALEGIFPSQN